MRSAFNRGSPLMPFIEPLSELKRHRCGPRSSLICSPRPSPHLSHQLPQRARGVRRKTVAPRDPGQQQPARARRQQPPRLPQRLPHIRLTQQVQHVCAHKHVCARVRQLACAARRLSVRLLRNPTPIAASSPPSQGSVITTCTRRPHHELHAVTERLQSLSRAPRHRAALVHPDVLQCAAHLSHFRQCGIPLSARSLRRHTGYTTVGRVCCGTDPLAQLSPCIPATLRQAR
jgi:hypothetical protein